MAALLAGGGVDRAGAAQGGEARLGPQPAWVVAGGDQQRGGDNGADALLRQEPGRGRVLEECLQGGVQLGDLGGQRLVAAGHRGHRGLRAFGRAGQVAGKEPGGQRYPLRRGQAGQPCPQDLGGGDNEVAELVSGLGAGLDRAAAGHLQRPDRLRRPVTGLRRPRRIAVQGGQRGGDRVGGIGLAVPTAGLPVRPDHLGHLHAGGGQVAGQAGAVAAGALHADLHQFAVAPHPGQRRPEARPGGRELLGPQDPAYLVDHAGHVHLGVGVHAPGDEPDCICDRRHVVSILFRDWDGIAGPGRTDRALLGQQRSGSYQVTVVPDRRVTRPPVGPRPAIRDQDTLARSAP